MIKGGKGGANTGTGLRFEKRVDLKTVLMALPGYQAEGNRIFFRGRKVAEVFKKSELYSRFLKPRGIDFSRIISQKLLPDNALYVPRTKTLFIVEVKFQHGSGSVDEKLQTCDFKLRQYKRLLRPLGITVKYAYVLNGWFRAPRYKDVFTYIELVGCNYFFNLVPLNYFGLPKGSKK